MSTHFLHSTLYDTLNIVYENIYQHGGITHCMSVFIFTFYFCFIFKDLLQVTGSSFS